MNCGLRDGSASNDNIDSSFSKSLDESFKLVLLGLGVVLELISRGEKNGSLGLSLVHLKVGVEYGNLSIGDSMNRGLRLSGNNMSVNNL